MTLALLFFLAQAPEAPAADAPAIMAKLAANLDAGLGERRQWIYRQKVRGRMVRANGQLSRQEIREYQVTPGPERTEKKLVSFAGEHRREGKNSPVIPFTEPGQDVGGWNIDGDVLDDLINDLVDDKESRDGIPHGLFPFRTKDLDAYHFTYLGSSEVKGRAAHRIGFTPKRGVKQDSFPWKGEILVDAEEHQPVRVFTVSPFKMPWAVKAFLGTDFRQMGFSLTYQRVAPNVWFPAAYGSEFRVDVLFGYKRVITLSLDSADFRRTDASTTIQYQTEEK